MRGGGVRAGGPQGLTRRVTHRQASNRFHGRRPPLANLLHFPHALDRPDQSHQVGLGAITGRRTTHAECLLSPRRQKKLDRAPATIVSSLPERLWTPEDWEKEDDDLVERARGAAAGAGVEEDTAPPLGGTPTSPIAVPGAPSGANDQPEASGSQPSSHGARHRYFSKDECAICLQSFQRGEVIRILPCGHLFHKEEVDDWLIRWKKLCPVCRT